MSEHARGSRVKWAVGTMVGLVGAGGGIVALLQYADSTSAAAESEYQEALEEWRSFAPASISGTPNEVELLGGWFVDLDLGRSSMSATGRAWDLRFTVDREHVWIGILANAEVEWSDLGTVDFATIPYRDLRDAEFTDVRAGRGDKYLYYSHITAAVGPGYTFAVRTPADHVGKVQIVNYVLGANSRPRGVRLRYEFFPIASDPPRPRRR